jgi:hypothetical protein
MFVSLLIFLLQFMIMFNFFIPIHDCVHVHDNAHLVHYHIPICDGDYVSAHVSVCDNVHPFTSFYS